MKPIFFILYLFILQQVCLAQEKFTLGVAVAPEISGQTASILINQKTKQGVGYTGGMQIDLYPFKNMGFFVGLNFFQKNLKIGVKEINVIDEDDPVYIAFKRNDNFYKKNLKENYVETTVGIALRTTQKKLSIYSTLGISCTMILNQYDPVSEKKYSREQLKTTNYNSDLFNGIAGIGLQYPLGNKFKIMQRRG